MDRHAELPGKELTDRIIQAAITVHRELGPGFLEAIYEEALCIELDVMGLRFERQRSVPLLYRGRPIGEHRLDVLVEGIAVVELKAISALERIHFATVRSYMKAVDTDIGLLLNFSAMPLTIKRVGRERENNLEIRNSGTSSSLPDFLSSRLSRLEKQQ